MTAQERLDHLLAPAGIPTGISVTLAHVQEAIGDDAYTLVRLTLEAATVPQDETIAAKRAATDMADAIAAMRVSGLLLSPPERQDMIDQLAVAGEWPDSVRDAVKALGIDNRPRWIVEGRAEEPTLESVQAEINQEQLRDWWTAQQAVISEGIFDGTITTQTEAIAAIVVGE